MTPTAAARLAKAIVLMLKYKKELSSTQKIGTEREIQKAYKRLNWSYDVLYALIRQYKKNRKIIL